MKVVQTSPEKIDGLVASYEKLGVAWDAAQQARKANRLFDRLHAIALQLRSLEAGQRGLENLLSHDNRGVRLSAAAECLAWGSEPAIRTLEGLVTSRGAHTFTARITLEEYLAGRMRFDW